MDRSVFPAVHQQQLPVIETEFSKHEYSPGVSSGSSDCGRVRRCGTFADFALAGHRSWSGRCFTMVKRQHLGHSNRKGIYSVADLDGNNGVVDGGISGRPA